MAILLTTISWLSLTLTRVPNGVASVWIANGLLVGWLLSRATGSWPRYLTVGLVSGVLAPVLADDTWMHAVTLTLVNLLEVVFIAGMVRRRVPDVANPQTWLRLGRIATLSTLVACAISGLIAAATISVLIDAPFLANFLIWYAAHVIGIVLVSTLTMVSHRRGAGLWGGISRPLDFSASMLLTAFIVGAIFAQSSYPLLFLVYPPLLWAAYRHGFAGVIGGIGIVAVISSVMTSLDHGPMLLADGMGNTGHTFLVQTFLAAACLLTFPVALVKAERNRLSARLRDSETHYRMLADYSHDVVVRMRKDGQRLYVSPSARDILGWEPAEMLEPGMVLVHPDDRSIQLQAIDRVMASGEPTTATYRLRHKDGHYIWIEAVARAIPSTHRDDTMDLIFAGRDVSQRMAAQQQLEESQRELEELARVDSLTGLANRRQFDERLTLALARSRRHQTPVALLYMDIDFFKRINDSLGHLVGDAVLKDFARRLSACVRTEDLVARLGGDEFVMLVEDATTAQVTESIARKLIGCIGKSSVIDDASIAITTSIGIAFCVRATDEAELLWYADKALYVAKGAGRNRYHLVIME